MRGLRVILVLLIGGTMVAAAVWALRRPVPVTTVRPVRGDAAEVVYASGVVEPRHWAKVTALVRQRIVASCNCEGEAVEAGKVLARLDDGESRAALAELRARARLAASEFERQAALSRTGTTTQRELDRARAEQAQAQALLAAREAALEDYVIKAPIDGTVLRQDGEVGEIAEPGEILFWVGKPKPLLVIADVNEEDIPRVEVGQTALLRSEAFPERPLEARVDSITPKGDPITKTYRVRLLLPPETPLLIGMTVDVNIVTGVSRNTLLVPSLALRGDAAMVAEDGIARRRNAVAGIRGIRDTEVLDGLGEKDRVIVPFPEALADGDRVAARDAAPGE